MHCKFRRTCAGLVVLLCATNATLATAQTAAGAARAADPNLQRESTERNQEYYRQREENRSQPSRQPVIKTPPRGQSNLPENGVRFTLKRITFNSSAFIDADRLRAIADEYTGHPVTFTDLNAMIDRINAIYAKRGIINARALLPPQTIENGVLRVRLVEGRLDQLDIDGNQSVRRSFLENRLPLTVGKVVDTPALRDRLTWLNRTTEMRLSAALRAGQHSGETGVHISVREPPRYSAQVFADNAGTESTGEYRGGAQLRMYSPLGVDDRLSLYGVGSKGATNGSLTYRFPFNRDGGRVTLSYSQGDIEIVDGPFTSLEITGKSSAYGARLTQPLVRRDSWWLETWFGATRIGSSTDIAGLSLSDYHVERYEAGITLRGFAPNQAWSVTQGIARAHSKNIFGDQTGLNLFTGQAFYLHTFGQRWSALVRGAWQYTPAPTAPSPLVFQIGGVSSVRGYQESALGGAKGYFVNLEGRYRWRHGLTPFVFIDQGMIDDISPDHENAASAGLGLSWHYRSLNTEITWGQTFRDVVPDQDKGRLNARIAWIWP